MAAVATTDLKLDKLTAINIENHGSGYLGMVKGFQCTRQMSG